MYKFLGIFFIAIAGTIAYLSMQADSGVRNPMGKDNCAQLTPAEQLVKLINDDFSELGATKQLPEAWNSISTIEYKMGSELAKALLGKTRKPTFERIKEGTAYLEMEIMDLPDEENPGIIIQASLFDIKSKNKIFEIGRTYTMNQLNKEEPVKNEKPTATAAPAATPSATATPNQAPTSTPAPGFKTI
jgi:hypothetical protein